MIQSNGFVMKDESVVVAVVDDRISEMIKPSNYRQLQKTFSHEIHKHKLKCASSGDVGKSVELEEFFLINQKS